MKAARYGGRLGALAITLGIGAGLAVPVSGVAGAETGLGPGPGPGDVTGPRTSATPPDAATRRGGQPRRQQPTSTPRSQTPGAKPRPAPAVREDSDRPVAAPEPDPRPPAIRRPAVPDVPAAPAGAESGVLAAVRTARPDPQPAVASPAPGPAPGGSAEPADAVAPVLGPLNQPGPSIPAAQPIPPAQAIPPTQSIPPTPSVPPAQAVRPLAGPAATRVLATLFGSQPGVPAESPINWVVLAAARRQLGGSGTTVAPPSATITTAAVNNPPAITNVVLGEPNSTTGVITGTVTASDPNADRITFRAATSTKGAVSISTAGVFTYAPTATARHAAAKAGAGTAVTTDTVTITATDAGGASTSRAIVVPILPRNAAPTATKTVNAPNASTGVVTGKITGSDVDRDPLTYTANAPAKGTLSIAAGTGAFTYTPTPAARHAAARTGATAEQKSDVFTVTVSDGYGGSVTVPVGVTISPANAVPTGTAAIARPDPLSGIAKGTVSAADADRDPLSYAASKPPNGTVTVNPDGSFAYTPTAAARVSTTAKTDTFTITVTDGYGGRRAVSVTATIAPADAAPVAGTPSVTINPTTGVVTGAVNAVDPDKDPLTYTAATTTTAKGRVTVTAAGAFTYTPTAAARHIAARGTAAPADRTDSFAVTVTDRYGAAAVVTVAVPVSPANAAPVAGATTIGAADPVTRVVTGIVRATDADNDTLTYTAPGTTAAGAVAVDAGSGSFTYTPRATTTGTADAFTVTVSDGHGGAISVPVAVSFGALAAPGALSTFCGCTLMPADSVFHADVSSLPVLAKSSTWTTLLGGNLFAAWGGQPWMGNTAGMPVNTVGAGRAGEKVVFNRGYSTSGPSIDDSLYAIPDYPLVEGMPAAPGWDRHLLVLQEGTCVSQELYNVANGVELPASDLGDALANSIYAGTYGSAWIAEAGVRYDMNSALYPAIGWANASRLPYLPLILRPDDLARGSIDHILGITIAKDRGTGYTWPARAGDGTGTNPDGVPMGTVLRLRADFDVTKFDPSTQVVLRALQKHGAVVYDSHNPGQSGATLLAMSNGWSGTGYLTAQQQLRTIPMSAFDAVDVLSLAADPATGWAIRSTAAGPVPQAAVPAGAATVAATGPGARAAAAVSAVGSEDYVLIRRAELMSKPTSGAGWAFVKSQADAAWEAPDLSRLNTKTPAMVLAAGLVYARTGQVEYRDKVIAAVKAVPGTEAKAADVLPFARNVFGYVVAADLVDMPLDTMADNGQTWRVFLEQARTRHFPGNTRWSSLEKTSGDSASNWNAYALSSHLAISTVLGDSAAVARDIAVYRRFLGDITSPWPAFKPTAGYSWNGNGRTWDMTPTLQRGINPDKPGDARSGAIILDASRHTSLPSIRWGKMDLAGRAYTEETLDALLAINMVLRAQGSDFTGFQNQALRRAYAFLARNGGPSGYSNGRYLASAINNMYATTYNTSAGDSVGRHLGYGGWLFKR